MSVLTTFSDLPIASPLVGIGAHPALPDADTLCLLELTRRGLLHIRGVEAEAALQVPGLNIGGVAVQPDGLLIRTRRDEFSLLTRTPQKSLAWLEHAVGARRVTLTDITHGRCALLVRGHAAPEMLTKVCALDFSNPHFPNMHAAQSSLAKVRTLIVRADVAQTPAYALVVDRSLAAYLWGVVFDAMHEFGGTALNQESLNHLGETSLW